MEEAREENVPKSAFDSKTFEGDISIHVDSQHGDCGAATISPSGRDIAIASKFGLDIIDLDSPLNPPRRLRHGQSWSVADVQWSPFAARDYWVASTSNQKAIVWNLSMSDDGKQGAIEHTLQAHTRAITDINFSAHHMDVLSTCAVDGYVNCWDLRRPRRPVMTFVDWNAGATQVKWNRQNGHILASSHDRWLRIWDERKGAYPLRSIEAHKSKIYGVDWNRLRETCIVTCSLDKTIKFWDYDNDLDIPERVIETGFPVWRARHTPFGWGLLAMPQDLPGNLYLYDRRKENVVADPSTPASTIFQGHGDKQVKEFLWRSRGCFSDDGIDNREFQLVSWGQDKQLRLHHVDAKALAGVGFYKGTQVRKKLSVTRKGAAYRTFRDVEKPKGEKRSITIRGARPWSSDIDTATSALTESMNRMPPKSPHSQRGLHGSAMKGRAVLSEKRSQIVWMRGIKGFNKSTPNGKRNKSFSARRLSVMSPTFDGHGDWDTAEPLNVEIVRVSHLFSRVAFENVNMDKHTLTVSMNGPWGENGESVFLRVNIGFPENYPEAKVAPKFSVVKGLHISEEIYIKIVDEVEQIAEGFVGRRRGCLEAAICYLLGEADLEESTMWLSGSQGVVDDDDDDNMKGLGGESSSEDDDSDMPAGASAMMSQELDPNTSEALIPVPRHPSVPLPPVCGARFAASGKLICFFPLKEEKVKSLFRTVNINRDRSRSEPYFNSFARLKSVGAAPRSKLSSAIDADDESDGDSSESADSQDSSSSDSDSSQFRGGVTFDFWRKIHGGSNRKTVSTNRSHSSTAGTGTGTGTAHSRARSMKPKNIISIHDMHDQIPAKLELANEYAIFGDGAEVCNHNAVVAETYGHTNLADVWRYAAMLLQHEVPLEVLDQAYRREPILIIAREMIKRCRRDSGSDSGVDLSNDLSSSRDRISGRVKWGYHPLAKPLIDDLFDYFEKEADIQMLAMLSCIFSEPSVPEWLAQPEVRLTQPQTPLSMKTPGFSLDYFPTDAVAWSTYRKTPYGSVVSNTKISQTPTGLSGSLGSSNGGPWSGDPASNSYSCGNTPPLRSGRGSTDKLPVPQNLSVSPDETRSFKRTGSTGLASTFAASITRPFTTTAPSSPPNRKRPSPVESIVNSFAPAVTWGNTTVLESVREQGYSGRTSYSDDDAFLEDGKPLPVTGISIVIHNQHAFDDESCMSASLLGFNHSTLFSSYRRQYSALLFQWNIQLARLEIMKFDSLPEYFSQSRPGSPVVPKAFAASITSNNGKNSISDISPPSPGLLGKKDMSHIDRGLDIAGYCLKHEYRLEPLLAASPAAGGAIGRCERCKMTKTQLSCVICDEPVTETYSPCLSCGCVNHMKCLGEYHEAGDRLCPGGCDCDCSAKAGMGFVESWEVMMSAIEVMRQSHGDGKHRKSDSSWDGADRGDWERLGPDRAMPPSPGPGSGYSGISRRLGQVRTGDWGSGLRRTSSILSKHESV